MEKTRSKDVRKGQRCRCLLVVPRGWDAPRALVDGLTKRDVAVREVNDSPTAMIELAAGQCGIVIIVAPDATRDGVDLGRAVKKYYKNVVCWQYKTGGVRGLEKFTPGSKEEESISVAVSSKCETFGGESKGEGEISEDKQTFSGAVDVDINEMDEETSGGDTFGGDTSGGDTSGGGGGPLLSDEELAMLLGDYEEDEQDDAEDQTEEM